MPRRLLLPLLLLAMSVACSIEPDDAPRDPPIDEPHFGPVEPLLPEATGLCPQFVGGRVTFSPAGMGPREVMMWAGSPPAEGAPRGALVFYWHGTGSDPIEALLGLGLDSIQAIIGQGGVVVSPIHDPSAGTYPWFLTAVGAGEGRDDDLRLVDEVVACAKIRLDIDPRRIHSLGMSAGALQTTALAYRRSDYIASVATYSGGIIEQLGTPRATEPDNPLAALIFHGGPQDVVVVNFEQTSEAFYRELRSRGHFAALCDHGRKHTIPVDATNFVWEFFRAHPFDRVPSPWLRGLPTSAPSYCTLAP